MVYVIVHAVGVPTNLAPPRRKETAWQVALGLGAPGRAGQRSLFLRAKMGQDSVDVVLIVNASDDFDSPTAATANLKRSAGLSAPFLS